MNIFWIHYPHVIRFVADLFFSTQDSEFKNIRIDWQIRGMHVDSSRIRKEKVVDSKISGYIHVDGASVLRLLFSLKLKEMAKMRLLAIIMDRSEVKL